MRLAALASLTALVFVTPVAGQAPSARELADMRHGVPNGSWRSTYTGPDHGPGWAATSTCRPMP